MMKNKLNITRDKWLIRLKILNCEVFKFNIRHNIIQRHTQKLTDIVESLPLCPLYQSN